MTDSHVFPPFSAGFKIHELTLTPAQLRLSVGETLKLLCTAKTELNVGIEFNWTHSGQALVSEQGLSCSSPLLWSILWYTVMYMRQLPISLFYHAVCVIHTSLRIDRDIWLPVSLARIPYFLLSGILQFIFTPSQSAKVTLGVYKVLPAQIKKIHSWQSLYLAVFLFKTENNLPPFVFPITIINCLL